MSNFCAYIKCSQLLQSTSCSELSCLGVTDRHHEPNSIKRYSYGENIHRGRSVSRITFWLLIFLILNNSPINSWQCLRISCIRLTQCISGPLLNTCRQQIEKNTDFSVTEICCSMQHQLHHHSFLTSMTTRTLSVLSSQKQDSELIHRCSLLPKQEGDRKIKGLHTQL